MRAIFKHFDELSTKELYAIAKLRSEVFVLEQNCLYLDLDDKDYSCWHLYFEDEKTKHIVAYCRIIPKGLSFNTISIGIVLTKNTYRNQGLSRKLMLKAIDIIHNQLNEHTITIAAQYYLKKFYESLGFKAISNTYLDDGIKHINMSIE